MSLTRKFMGLAAGLSAVATVGVALAQDVPPVPNAANAAMGAGQLSVFNTPMGETGVLPVYPPAPTQTLGAGPEPATVVAPQPQPEVVVVTPPPVAVVTPPPQEPQEQVQTPSYTPPPVIVEPREPRH